MNIKASPYQNRYGDTITFVEIKENLVEMSGYNPEWLRAAWANDYSEAYEVYENLCKSSDYPSYDLFIDDPISNSTRMMTYQEFSHEVAHNEKYHHYLKLVKSDKNQITMVDPSGGPYINIGTDVGRYFGDNKKRIVDEIRINNGKTIFTVSNK